MNSKYQFSLSSTEPIEQSSTHWQLGWLKTVRLDLPLFHYWREWVRRECGMLSRWEQSCNTGMIEAVIIVPRTELGGNSIQTAKSGRKSIELSCSGDHSPTYIVRFSWQSNLQRQVWWDLPCRRWTESSSNKTGSSTWIVLHHSFIHQSQSSPVPMNYNVPPCQSPSNAIPNNSCMGWMSAIDYMKLRHVFRVRDQYQVHTHIFANAITRSHKLFIYQSWLATEEWRPYLCSCDQGNPII